MEALTTTEEEKKRRQRIAKEREFWERLANVVSPDTYQVWLTLEKELTKYNGILQERANLLDENSRIKTQNDELKVLLNQYMTASVSFHLFSRSNISFRSMKN